MVIVGGEGVMRVCMILATPSPALPHGGGSLVAALWDLAGADWTGVGIGYFLHGRVSVGKNREKGWGVC